MAELNVTLPLWWVLGIIIAGVAGSYGFTWLVFNKMRDSVQKCWEAYDKLVKNDLKHIEGRLTALEKE